MKLKGFQQSTLRNYINILKNVKILIFYYNTGFQRNQPFYNENQFNFID